jgi:hypothetical protein
MPDEGSATPARRLLPLHDATATIACTIGAHEIPDRIAVIEWMRDAMTSIERSDTGLLLKFPGDPAVEAVVHRFAVDERRCCEFWNFAVLVSDDSILLRWDGPPSAAPVLDRLGEFFRSNHPAESAQFFL